MKNLMMWGVIVLLVVGLFQLFQNPKNSVVMEQKFEDAANLRDKEQKLISKLEKIQKKWKSNEELNPAIISEDNIADVVSTMTRIPVRRVAETEGQKLLKMNEELYDIFGAVGSEQYDPDIDAHELSINLVLIAQ